MSSAEEITDAIERARHGDPRGFETLFCAFGASVAGYLRGRGVRDSEGVANDVFLRVFRTIHGFEGDADRFRAWLFTIAHHASVDDARSRGRRVREAPIEEAAEASGGDAETAVMARLAHERVGRLLNGLSPDQRDVLMLRIVSDLSVEDTAAILGKGYEAVRALQRRGLAALRRSISEQEGVRR